MSKSLNATAVIPLTPRNVEFLKKLQFNVTVPEGAKYLALLEDGEACFLDQELPREPGKLMLPKAFMINYYENIQIEF